MGDDEKDYVQQIIDGYIRSHQSHGVIPSLMLSGIFKLSTNQDYDLADESRIYEAYLANYNIHTRYSFRSAFMSMMTGKDPTIIDLGIVGTEGKILNEDGSFVSEEVRRRIAAEGRLSQHLGPRLTR